MRAHGEGTLNGGGQGRQVNPRVRAVSQVHAGMPKVPVEGAKDPFSGGPTCTERVEPCQNKLNA